MNRSVTLPFRRQRLALWLWPLLLSATAAFAESGEAPRPEPVPAADQTVEEATLTKPAAATTTNGTDSPTANTPAAGAGVADATADTTALPIPSAAIAIPAELPTAQPPVAGADGSSERAQNSERSPLPPMDAPLPEAPPSGAIEAATPGSTATQRPAADEPRADEPRADGPAADALVETAPAADGTTTTAPAEAEEAPLPDNGLSLLGSVVPPGTSTRLAWTPSDSFAVISVPTPVMVINGAEPGPTLCLTAAIHGDELTGIEIVRRVMFGINPARLRGAVVGIPIVNLQGFRRNSRYLPDRRDLNRYFPGNPKGSLAARVAHSLFHEVAKHCDAIVDMHTGSFHRTNLPQVRADMNHPGVAQLARNLGAIVVLQSQGNRGTLRRAAVEHGIPAVTLEAGEPMRLQEDQVAHGVQSVQSLLNGMNMYGRATLWGKPEPVYYKSLWVRSNTGGILFSRVKLGDRIRKGDVLGTVTDPISNARAELITPHDGRVIGMALNQVVMPGFAAYHIGIQTTEEHAAEPVEGVVEADEPAEGDTDTPEADVNNAIEADKAAAPPPAEFVEPDVLEDS